MFLWSHDVFWCDLSPPMWQLNSRGNRRHVGSDIKFVESKWANFDSPVGSESIMVETCKHCSVRLFSNAFLMPSTGGTVEPGEENCGWVQNLLPAPPPRRPSLLPEIQVCQSSGGSGDLTSRLFRKSSCHHQWASSLVHLSAPWHSRTHCDWTLASRIKESSNDVMYVAQVQWWWKFPLVRPRSKKQKLAKAIRWTWQ